LEALGNFRRWFKKIKVCHIPLKGIAKAAASCRTYRMPQADLKAKPERTFPDQRRNFSAAPGKAAGFEAILSKGACA
jgi:hypothetical protein